MSPHHPSCFYPRSSRPYPPLPAFLPSSSLFLPSLISLPTPPIPFFYRFFLFLTLPRLPSPFLRFSPALLPPPSLASPSASYHPTLLCLLSYSFRLFPPPPVQVPYLIPSPFTLIQALRPPYPHSSLFPTLYVSPVLSHTTPPTSHSVPYSYFLLHIASSPFHPSIHNFPANSYPLPLPFPPSHFLPFPYPLSPLLFFFPFSPSRRLFSIPLILVTSPLQLLLPSSPSSSIFFFLSPSFLPIYPYTPLLIPFFPFL